MQEGWSTAIIVFSCCCFIFSSRFDRNEDRKEEKGDLKSIPDKREPIRGAGESPLFPSLPLHFPQCTWVYIELPPSLLPSLQTSPSLRLAHPPVLALCLRPARSGAPGRYGPELSARIHPPPWQLSPSILFKFSLWPPNKPLHYLAAAGQSHIM